MGYLKRGNVIKTYGIRLSDGQHVKGIDETGYTYLGTLETDTIKKKEMQEKFSKSICDC